MAGNIFEEMAKVRQKLPELAPQLFHIRTKGEGITKFNLSEAQTSLALDPNLGNDIILKARQLGISTYTVLEFLAYWLFIEGFNGAIISEDRDKTKKLLGIARLAYRMMPKKYQVPMEHSREDYLISKAPSEGGKGSSLYIGTAGTKHFGRGDTIHAAHCSELGLWVDAEEILIGLEESVPQRKGAILRIESTAFGQGNHFHKICDRAMHGRGGRYKFRFFPWWFAIDDEYQVPLDEGEVIVPTDAEKEFMERVWEQYQFKIGLEHIKWRRLKIDQKGESFLQEYPEDPQSCFLSTGNKVFHGIMKLLYSRGEHIRYFQPMQTETRFGIEVKKYKMPKADEVYMITVDTSEGKKIESAYDACTVWKVHESNTLEQCATFSGRVDTGSLVSCIVELARDYNNALVAVERANKGFSVLDKLQEAQQLYDFDVYHHTEFDQIANKNVDIPGWRPTQPSKAAAIGRFEEMFKSGELIIYDPELIDQAMAYQNNPNTGKPEAPEGTYCDLLTTAYMAAYCYEQAHSSRSYGVKDIY